MRRVVTLIFTVAVGMVLLISYAWAMECPSDTSDNLKLELKSVTVDGVQQEDLPAYYQSDAVVVTLSADIERSQILKGKNPLTANYTILRFKSPNVDYGSYDEIFSLDSDDN